MASTDLKVFAGRSNPALAEGIYQSLAIEPGRIEFIDFSNENIKVKICENVRGRDVFFIQTSCPPVSSYLMELLIALDALKYGLGWPHHCRLTVLPICLSRQQRRAEDFRGRPFSGRPDRRSRGRSHSHHDLT